MREMWVWLGGHVEGGWVDTGEGGTHLRAIFENVKTTGTKGLKEYFAPSYALGS